MCHAFIISGIDINFRTCRERQRGRLPFRVQTADIRKDKKRNN